MATRIFHIAVAILLLSDGSSKAASAPEGPNCKLIEPPASSGEVPNSTEDLRTFARVYPRLAEITDAYTGCQAVWITSSGAGDRPYLVIIERGEVKGVWPSPSEPLCNRGQDTRTGCRVPLSLLMPSYPSGCLHEGRQSGRLSPACVESFLSESTSLTAKRFSTSINDMVKRSYGTDPPSR